MKASEKEKIFLELLQENKDKIYRLCFGYLNNKSDMDDLFQEIMINIWNNLEKFRHESSMSTWIYRISVNSALLFNKKSQRKKKLFSNLQSEHISFKSEEDTQEELEEQLTQLHKSIASLKKQDRLIISLLLEGMSYNEISNIVGLTPNYIAVKINRIKPILVKIMKAI